ncbi:hypothetical protein [Butyrivibrio sp. AE3009]|uniref:hypothetical protein n=1 Tax=Butyrivibrio sp. AE3009 TaxID=1280666 RepID=UPI0003B712AD|nr:hypothetical protein [Butyrivibrio sp. AE3009]
MFSKNRSLKTIVGILFSLLLMVGLAGNTAYAYSEIPACFDFGDTVLSIDAGGCKEVWFRSTYNYTYFVGPHTSTGTYCECSFKSGTEYIKLHIGADEKEKNVFFHFYVDDDKVPTKDLHDNIEVYVQKAAATSESIAVSIAGGSGTLTRTGNIAMLYNSKGVAMASFSLSKGAGNMASIGLKGVANNGSNYFDVVSGNNATPMISESDKAVMIANGYAGVCVNGVYKNWP